MPLASARPYSGPFKPVVPVNPGPFKPVRTNPGPFKPVAPGGNTGLFQPVGPINPGPFKPPSGPLAAPPGSLASVPTMDPSGLPSQLPPPAPYTPPNVPPVPGGPTPQTFPGTAPKPTPYGDFAGLDPRTFEHSPDFQYLMDTQQKAMQRGAAAHGTLLTGGFQKELQKHAAGLAAGDFGNAFNRALSVYDTNRDTNAQNFGQDMEGYRGNLAAFGANTDAALGYGRLGLETQRTQYDQGRQTALDTQANAQAQNDYNAAQGTLSQAQADRAYAQQVEATRQANAAYTGLPVPKPTMPGRRAPFLRGGRR